jgi:hypothetical protein
VLLSLLDIPSLSNILVEALKVKSKFVLTPIGLRGQTCKQLWQYKGFEAES